MRAGGRFRPAVAGLHSLLYLYVSITLTASSEYGVPIEIKLWDTGRTPLAHMVDVTNGFGLKVLAEHNFLNDNNIAFSPYGLMGILVALYEGVDGEASFQIQSGMQLPWNRNVMRIGFRDIHRTLKTYFVPEEGFLAGLALNNENVTFNENYKKVLRFYGFDLENDKLPSLPPNNGTNDTTTSAAPIATEAGGETTPTTVAMSSESAPAQENTASTQAREDTTPNPNAETINDVDIRGPTTTVSSSSASNAESTTDITSTVEQEVNTELQITEKITEQTTPQTTAAITTTMPSSPEDVTTTETQTSPLTSPTSSAPLTDEPTVNNEVDAGTTADMPTTASTAAETSTVTTDTEQSTQMMETESTMTTMSEMLSTIPETQQIDEESTPTTDMTTLTDVTMTTATDTNLETLERRKKSIVDFIFTNPPYVDDYLFYRSYDIPVAPEFTPDFDDNKMFLVNGLRNVQVTYMHYDTVLEHAYLPHLEASALRLPLDSERYYLLVVLPTRGGAPELGRLLARMARESDLSDVYAALRPRRVRAIVPSFTVKGHVTLTTDLQKLGIRDVFEPRQRDFSPMTHQPGVYVRSIEQAVSVAIRKYRPDDHKKNRYVISRQPVSFSATYPFLYFVMDSSIHVALMAGKMVDPLNSRIL